MFFLKIMFNLSPMSFLRKLFISVIYFCVVPMLSFLNNKLNFLFH